MRHRTLPLVIAVVSSLIAPAAWATTYAVDKDHTTVSFRIRHLFSNVTGTFDDFEGQFTYVPDHPEQWTATGTAQAASINTKVPQRDKHLRSADFFDVEKFPALTFRSTEATDVTPAGAKLHGLLSIHGVEKPAIFYLVVHGEGKDPWGNQRSGVTATTRINRKEFGLNWNQALETGGVLVGDDVEIILEIEGLAKDAPAPTP